MNNDIRSDQGKLFVLSCILLAVFLLAMPATSTAQQVQQLNQRPQITNYTEGSETVDFFGQVQTLSQWQRSSSGNLFDLDTSPVHTAFQQGHSERSLSPLTQTQIENNLGNPLGPEVWAFYKDRKAIRAKKAPPKDALVFEIQMTKSISEPLSNVRKKLSSGVELLRSADRPHSHIEIPIEFARNLIEPLHSGQRALDHLNPETDHVILTAIRMSAYDCQAMVSFLNTAIELFSGSVPVVNGEKVVNLYSISILREASSRELMRLGSVFGSPPDYAVLQEVIYSSTLVEDGLNVWAAYESGNTTHLASYSLIATDPRLSRFMKAAINGVTAGSVVSAVRNFENDERTTVDVETGNQMLEDLWVEDEGQKQTKTVISGAEFPMMISSDVIDLSRNRPSYCDTGLSKGIPFYVIDLFRNIP